MALVVVLAQLHRLISHAFSAGLRNCQRCSKASSSSCYGGCIPKNSNINSVPGAYRFSNPTKWGDDWLGKRSSRHRDFLHRDAHRLNYNDRLVWVPARPGTMGAEPRGLEGLYGTSSRSGSEVQKLCQEGHLDRALSVLLRIDQDGTTPSVEIYRSLLKACTKRKALGHAKHVHAHLVHHGLESVRYLGESVVKTFVKCGSLEDALQVFDRLPRRSVVSWTAVISGYVSAGQGHKALSLYRWMQDEGVQPSKFTFVSLLQACGSKADLEEGKRIHAEVCKYRCESDLFVHTCILDMYAKCGSIVHAQNVFDSLPQHDVVSWTVMIAAYAQQGQAEKALQMYDQMREEGVTANDRTFVSVLQACGVLAEEEDHLVVDGRFLKVKSLEKGKAFHADARRNAYESDVFIGNTLLSMYGKCGSILDAQTAFDGLFQRNVVSWNAMLAAYVQHTEAVKALQLYETMLEEGISPNDWTFMTVIQACQILGEKEAHSLLASQSAQVRILEMGKAIHADIRRKGYIRDVLVSTALVSMYNKCGSIEDARNVFDDLSKRNVVTWTTMVAAYAQQGQAELALQLYEQMSEEAVTPDAVTFVSVLQACALLAETEENVCVEGHSIKVKSLEHGKAIHAAAQMKGCTVHFSVGNALVSMYGKCGSFIDARNVFDGLTQRDVVSWNAILAAYAQHGHAENVLHLYRQMEEEGMRPDEITHVCVLQACSSTGSLDLCRHIHNSFASSGNNLGPHLANTLIHAYGRCGSMLDASTVFSALSQPDVISWSTLIAGYAREGNSTASLLCYEQMQLAGTRPNRVTFLSVLSACCHAGMVEKGIEYFESMSRDHGITPEIEHYAIMVDLLGRAGYFKEIQDFFVIMPREPDLAMWSSLLGACQKHGNVVLAEQAFNCAIRLQRDDAAAYVLMWNIYADAGLWKHAEGVKELRQRAGAWKKPGQSWIEHDHKVYTFVVGASKHSHQDLLQDLLKKLTSPLTHTRVRPHDNLYASRICKLSNVLD